MTGTRRPDAPRVPVLGVVRVLGLVWGLGLAVVAGTTVPPVAGRWIGGTIAVAVVLAAVAGGRFTSLVPWAVAGSVGGAVLASVTGRLPVPTAAVIGLLAVGYLVLAELADAHDDETTAATRAGTTTWRPLAGWVRTMAPMFLAALLGAVALSLAVVLPLPPAGWLVIAAPVVLVAAVAFAVGRRFGG